MRFTAEDVNQIENAARGKCNPMNLFLDEWGTMGKTRFPNVKDLLKICLTVNELTAADYINKEILNQGNFYHM